MFAFVNERHVALCAALRQSATACSCNQILSRCRGRPANPPKWEEVVAKNPLWRPSHIGAIALLSHENSYVCGLVYGGVYGKRSRKRIAVRGNAVSVASVADVSRLKGDPHLACSHVAVASSELWETMRRCALRPRGAASCASIARRRRLVQSAYRGTGERTSR